MTCRWEHRCADPHQKRARRRPAHPGGRAEGAGLRCAAKPRSQGRSSTPGSRRRSPNRSRRGARLPRGIAVLFVTTAARCLQTEGTAVMEGTRLPPGPRSRPSPGQCCPGLAGTLRDSAGRLGPRLGSSAWGSSAACSALAACPLAEARRSAVPLLRWPRYPRMRGERDAKTHRACANPEQTLAPPQPECRIRPDPEATWRARRPRE
mmetsp:Transcript_1596/g.6394  ORF Transcript_1596/g.6394 Transcript_1596/m.6394 type:complete len:207 (+) Transcript_1596:1290-1910(+)